MISNPKSILLLTKRVRLPRSGRKINLSETVLIYPQHTRLKAKDKQTSLNTCTKFIHMMRPVPTNDNFYEARWQALRNQEESNYQIRPRCLTSTSSTIPSCQFLAAQQNGVWPDLLEISG